MYMCFRKIVFVSRLHKTIKKCKVKVRIKVQPRAENLRHKTAASALLCEFAIAKPKDQIAKDKATRKNSLFVNFFGLSFTIYTPK